MQFSKSVSKPQTGDQKAVVELLDGYRNYLKLLAQMQMSQQLTAKMDPSDLVQETLLGACRDFPQCHGQSEEELVGWLRAILKNRGRRMIRQFKGAQRRDICREKQLGDAIDQSAASISKLASPIYSVGCERSVHYYAMQHIEGQTLAELIATLWEAAGTNKTDTKRSRLPECSQKTGGESRAPTKVTYGDTSLNAGLATARSHRDKSSIGSVVNLFIQAAEALDTAHGEGVIHRDVKPSNVMLDGRGKIFVTYFGLAHVKAGPSVTITGDFLATLRYMSPEQAIPESCRAKLMWYAEYPV